MNIFLCLGLLLLPTHSAASGEIDTKALAEAEALLKNPAVLTGPAGSPNEKAALSQIEKITKGDPKAQKEIQDLSSEIFADLVQKNGQNEMGIGAALLEAQRDPAKFMQSLSPEQQKRIRDLASEIDGKKK